MPPLPPLPPPLPRRFPFVQRLRDLTTWSIAASIAVHLVFAVIFATYHPPVDALADNVVISNITVTTPPPRPTPAPTPVPTMRPLPTHERAAGPPNRAPLPHLPAAAPIRLNVTRSIAKASGQSTERGYIAPRTGRENGLPGGTGTSTAAGATSSTGAGTSNGAGDGGTAPVPAAPETAVPRPPAPLPTPTCGVPDVAATTTQAATPDYPNAAIIIHATGRVTVLVALDAEGDVRNATVYKSSGYPFLDRSGVAAARASKYAPEYHNCLAVAGVYLFIVDF